MSIRARLTILCAIAVGATVVLTTAVSYMVVRNHLRAQVDDAIRATSKRLADLPAPEIALTFFGLPQGVNDSFMSVTGADGRVQTPPDPSIRIPPTSMDRRLARTRARSVDIRDADVGGHHLRIASAGTGDGQSVQFAELVDDVDATIADVRTTLLIVATVSVILAAIIALVVARAGLRPVTKLTRAAEQVAATQDLAATIETRRRDEVGRLASSFNAMLQALDRSRAQQQELVRDAGHELLTPLTSLRTNVELLAETELVKDDRKRVLEDISQQVAELVALMDDLVELATDPHTPSDVSGEVDFDRVVESAVDRARLRAPDLTFDVELEPTRIHGRARQLDRAAINLLDNACKWSPPGGRVEIRLQGGTLSIRDYGAGIGPEDLPRVFDRFYRAPAARAMPGSGLGLAIVRRVAESHDGTVSLRPAAGGGVIASFSLPSHLDEPIVVPRQNDADLQEA